jgi:hypothetical protein
VGRHRLPGRHLRAGNIFSRRVLFMVDVKCVNNRS